MGLQTSKDASAQIMADNIKSVVESKNSGNNFVMFCFGKTVSGGTVTLSPLIYDETNIFGTIENSVFTCKIAGNYKIAMSVACGQISPTCYANCVVNDSTVNSATGTNTMGTYTGTITLNFGDKVKFTAYSSNSSNIDRQSIANCILIKE